MTRRRGNREGSIFRRSQDGVWIGELYLGRDLTGGKQVLRFYGKSRREVQEKVTGALHDRHRGMLADPSRETVRQFLERWLCDSVRHSLRPATFASYAHVLRKHAMPEIGEVRLPRLTPAHIQRLYASKLDGGLSPRGVQYLHDILHDALEQAMGWGLVPRNVTDAVSRPRAERKALRVLSREEATTLLEASGSERLHALYVLAVTTGMRQGELFGLTWDAVSLEEARLQVRQQLERVRVRGGRPALTEPKTKTARRVIDLPVLAVRALRERRRQQLEERLALGPAWQDDWGLVFTTEIGTPLDVPNVRRSFLRLLERAGLPRIRFHDLRHTAATLLLAAGEHPKVVQERLGHYSVAFTLDTYAHVLPSMQKAAAARIDAILTTPAVSAQA